MFLIFIRIQVLTLLYTFLHLSGCSLGFILYLFSLSNAPLSIIYSSSVSTTSIITHNLIQMTSVVFLRVRRAPSPSRFLLAVSTYYKTHA